ncbi:MAG: hypothetical protein WCZ66_03255 [Sphingomonadaceae bacterium]
MIGGSTANDGNLFVAAAYGNDVNNGAMLSTGNVDTGGDFASVAAVSNTQAAGRDTSTIAATASGANIIRTMIEDNVTGAGVSTSGNTIQASAHGNRATANELIVSGNNIDTASTTPTTGVTTTFDGSGNAVLTANASFAVQNAQSETGAISASQLDNPATPTTAAGMLTVVGGDVADATILSEANRSVASATGNSANSTLSVAANGIASTTGLQNFQTSDADLSADIGLQGTIGTDPINFAGVSGAGVITGTGSSLTGGSILTLDAVTTIAFDFSAPSALPALR